MIVSCPLTTLPQSGRICKSEKLTNTDQQSPRAIPSPHTQDQMRKYQSGAALGIHESREIWSRRNACEKATTKERGILISRKTGLRLRAGAFSWGPHGQA